MVWTEIQHDYKQRGYTGKYLKREFADKGDGRKADKRTLVLLEKIVDYLESQCLPVRATRTCGDNLRIKYCEHDVFDRRFYISDGHAVSVEYSRSVSPFNRDQYLTISEVWPKRDKATFLPRLKQLDCKLKGPFSL